MVYNFSFSDRLFIKNKIQASFVTSDSNEWDYNYWNNWRVPFPKPILGLKEIPWWVTSLPIPWLNFDQNPVREPYDIPRI